MQSLRKEHRKQAGINDAPTSDMYEDCQELLQLFGLPYIIAPSEAEAQCAWLDAAGLVDGVVTDDNDVFLFGGRHVYRWGCGPPLSQSIGCCTGA
jgi:DNA excision repair protein ERCC-5